MNRTYIRDMLFVNTIEKRLGRKLTERELEDDEALELRFPDGKREFVMIPRLLFPDDVMSTSAQIDLEFSIRDDVSRSSNETSWEMWLNDHFEQK